MRSRKEHRKCDPETSQDEAEEIFDPDREFRSFYERKLSFFRKRRYFFFKLKILFIFFKKAVDLHDAYAYDIAVCKEES